MLEDEDDDEDDNEYEEKYAEYCRDLQLEKEEIDPEWGRYCKQREESNVCTLVFFLRALLLS